MGERSPRCPRAGAPGTARSASAGPRTNRLRGWHGLQGPFSAAQRPSAGRPGWFERPTTGRAAHHGVPESPAVPRPARRQPLSGAHRSAPRPRSGTPGTPPPPGSVPGGVWRVGPTARAGRPSAGRWAPRMEEVTHDPAVTVDHIEHDLAVTIERLESDGFKVERLYVDGALTPHYRVRGAIGDQNNASVLLPAAEALYWWWHGWWLGRHHGRQRAPSCHQSAARCPADERRRQQRVRWNGTCASGKG